MNNKTIKIECDYCGHVFRAKFEDLNKTRVVHKNPALPDETRYMISCENCGKTVIVEIDVKK
ncbi:MAG: hypothetical protein AAF639_46885 [Chloroflexota bacterium]